MPRIEIERGDLVVRLSPLEKLGAMRGDLRVPRKSVGDVRVTERPWDELRGVRAPGTGIPRVIMLGLTRGRGGRQFAAVYGNRPAVVVDLQSSPLSRLILCVPDPDAAAALIGRRPAR